MENQLNQNLKSRSRLGRGLFTKTLLANASKHTNDDNSLSPRSIQRLVNPMRSHLGLPTFSMDPVEVPEELSPTTQTPPSSSSQQQPTVVQEISDQNQNPTNQLLNASFLMDTLPYDSFNLSRSRNGMEDVTNSSVRIPINIKEDTKSFLIPSQSMRKDEESFQVPQSKSFLKSDFHNSRNLSAYSNAPSLANDSQDSFVSNRKFNRNPRPEEEEFHMNADFSKISLLCPERSRLTMASPSLHGYEEDLGNNFMTQNIQSVPEEVKTGDINLTGGELGNDDYSFLSSHEPIPETRRPLREFKENASGPVAAIPAAAVFPKSAKKPSSTTRELHKSENLIKKPPGRTRTSSADIKGKKNPKRKSSGWKFASESVQGKEYLIIKQLGKGGSGEVSLVLEKETRELYALKIVNLAGINDHVVKECINEVEMLEGLKDSDLVVHIFAWEVNKTDKNLKIVMEHGQCDLNSSIRTISSSVLKVKYVWETMLTIVDTIHKRGVVHSDLKPANFIWVGDKLKIIDFGIASRLQQDQTSIAVGNPKGTINFMSPESVTADMSGRAKVSTKSDIWSLGCILHLILFGKTPFEHISNTHLKLRAIGEGKVNFSALPFVTPVLNPYRDEFELILASCFHLDYRQRRSCQELLSSQFLQRF